MKKQKVVSIRSLKPQVNQELVKALEGCLEDAKNGKMQAITYFATFVNYTETFSAGSWEAKDALIGFEFWKHRLMHTLQDPKTDIDL